MSNSITSPPPLLPVSMLLKLGLGVPMVLLFGFCSVALILPRKPEPESAPTGEIYMEGLVREGTPIYLREKKVGTVAYKDESGVIVLTPQGTVEGIPWKLVKRYYRTLPERRIAVAPQPAPETQAAPRPSAPPRPANEEEAQRLALQKYPELGQPKSALNQRFVNKVRAYRASRPQMFADPAWPLLVADEVATR